jgi:hypothetical protein
VSFPSGAALKHEPKTEEGGRELIVDTTHIHFSISFKVVAGGELQYLPSKVPQRIDRALGGSENEFWVAYVTFKAAPKWLRRWSGRTADEMKWAREMAESFIRDFRWQAVTRDQPVEAPPATS